LEIDQVFGHVSPTFQASVGLFQALDLLVPGIGRFSTGLAAREARFSVLGQLPCVSTSSHTLLA